jgi:hypothetical protein
VYPRTFLGPLENPSQGIPPLNLLESTKTNTGQPSSLEEKLGKSS